MGKNQKLIFKPIKKKTIVWFKNTNKYLVLENTTADILKSLSKGFSLKNIAVGLSKKINVPFEKAADFISTLKKEVYDPNHDKRSEINNFYSDTKKPKVYEFVKFYKINDIVFKVSYLNENELSYIHPKFAHLSIDAVNTFQNEFEVFINNNFIFLYVNKNFIGSWSYNDVHYFQGKFSMELIQKIHQKEESEWLGVFHASAISNGEKAILFLGDSGNGKSTSLAILQATGLTCLADDFVPIDVKKQEAYSFPASISIKKNSLETLLPLYPELKNSAEYHFTRLNKIVRYLQPNNNNFFAHLPCNDIVFIKYEKEADILCHKITKIDAFQQLVPDSWLSPIEKNAKIFLDWFVSLNCYQITYSNNHKMIQAVSKIFNNDL